jgi:hypothetical protein
VFTAFSTQRVCVRKSILMLGRNVWSRQPVKSDVRYSPRDTSGKIVRVSGLGRTGDERPGLLGWIERDVS